MSIKSKSDAQLRVDQINVFTEEIALLECEEILNLSEAQKFAVKKYHDQFISDMSREYDIDASQRDKQLSLGMRIASFLGAIALAASLFFLFYQFWGNFSTSAQVVTLLLAPIIGLIITMVFSTGDTDGYFAKLAGMVTLSCFVLNLLMLGQIFNITPSENAFLIWAIFAFVLAYASDTRLLLAAGIISFTCFMSARMGTWFGCYWIHFGERPENFFLAAALLFSVSVIFKHRQYSGFNIIYRVFAMLIFFVPVLILSNWGYASYFNMKLNTIEAIYQVVGFLVSGGAIWAGIRFEWSDVVNTGNTFFVIFMYTRFFDWWWDLMPKYLFFLIIGLTSILILLVFKRIRKAQTIMREGATT